LKVLPESNRDSYIYKRVDVSGFLTENLFRDIYNRFKNDYQVMIDAQYNKNQSVRQTGAIVNLINNGNFKDVFKPHKFHTLMNTSFKGDFGKILDYNDKIIKEGKKGLI
jgi:DNA-directed RNA polymerase beta subunit